MAAPARNAVIAGALFVALFIGSIAIVLLANLEFGDNEAEELAWWKKTLIYHVYVPSFKDSNGDGMGDLKGKLAHCVKGSKILSENSRCLKITEKVLLNIASEASYVYILSGPKVIQNAKNGPFWRVFPNLKLAVKQCYQTDQF